MRSTQANKIAPSRAKPRHNHTCPRCKKRRMCREEKCRLITRKLCDFCCGETAHGMPDRRNLS